MGQPNWSQRANHTITPVKHFLANFTVVVRSDQFRIFAKIFHPGPQTTVLDVGATSDETLKGSNMFEKRYPYPNRLTVTTIEDQAKLRRLYPQVKVIKTRPNHPLPFADKQFDVVVSWATLEHVGALPQQQEFLTELARVGKGIWVTTPYRGCSYEPHTGHWFLHWLPLSWWRWLCRHTGQEFLADPANLNPLWVRDVQKMLPKGRKLEIRVYKTFGIFPSHLLIYSQTA